MPKMAKGNCWILLLPRAARSVSPPRRWKSYFFLLPVLMIMMLLLRYRSVFTPQCEKQLSLDEEVPKPLQRTTTQSQRSINKNIFTVDCDKVIAGNRKELVRINNTLGCLEKEQLTNEDYIRATVDCKAFAGDKGYFAHPVTKEEKDFPIAFSLLMYSHVEQAERLLRAIYRSHNVYCIHVDSKAAPSVLKAMESIASCFDNVFISPRLVNVRWGSYSVLEAELVCLEALWAHKTKWKYFINLTGQEYPIRTNLELVRILTAYNGANDVEGFTHRRPVDWTDHYYIVHWLPIPFYHRSPPPHNVEVHKGQTHAALSRAFVDFALHNETAQDLVNWMKHMYIPDEHFFSTLNHSPEFKVPGAYTGYGNRKKGPMRYKIWDNYRDPCEGTWVRWICNFGSGDLQRITPSKALFANKFRLDIDPVALHCMDKWYYDRVHRVDNEDFNITFYQRQIWVDHHV